MTLSRPICRIGRAGANFQYFASKCGKVLPIYLWITVPYYGIEFTLLWVKGMQRNGAEKSTSDGMWETGVRTDCTFCSGVIQKVFERHDGTHRGGIDAENRAVPLYFIIEWMQCNYMPHP